MLYVIAAYILLALWLSYYFVRSDRGEKEPSNALRRACWFGVVAVLLAGQLNSMFLPSELTYFLDAEEAVRPPLATLFYGAMMVGVIEESLKFFPLAFYIYKKKYFNEMTDGVIYFALAGMWFGVIESIMYTLSYGTDVGIMRIILAPFLHAGFSAIAGLGLAKFKLTKNPLYVITGLATAILLHGLYDFFLFSQIGPLILASFGIALMVNLVPFRYFKAARRIDEKLGLSWRFRK